MMPRGRPRGTSPHTWKRGPDPLMHEQDKCYRQQVNQANYRKEEWNISFTDWVALWGDNWENKGRGPNQYRMKRIDRTKPWTADNAVVATMAEGLRLSPRPVSPKAIATKNKEFTYIPDKCCKHCKSSLRYTKDGQCLECYSYKHPHSKKHML